MYVVDDVDTVLKLHTAPLPNVGAPLPLILCDESKLFLAYIADQGEGDGKELSLKSGGVPIAIVKFLSPDAHIFGPPNDEAFEGHPLACRGLEPYDVFEVEQSSWIRQLERMNAVHPNHNKERFFANRRHFIFTFHDSTFEVVADGFEIQLISGSLRSALSKMVEMIREDE